MKRILSLIVLITSIYLPTVKAVAQPEGRCVIKMVVIDSASRKPISYATVAVYNKSQNGPIKYSVSDEKGFVEIAKMTKENFILLVEHVGYMPKKVNVSTEKKRVVNLGEIAMSERVLKLDDVVVTGETAVVENGDTTIFNAKFFNPAPTDYLGDLLKKMPGLTINMGNVYFKGVRISSLRVDGRPFFSSDHSIALENLPAYTVKKASVYKKRSPLSQGVDKLVDAPLELNIELKDDMKVGYIGNLLSGYGTENRYLVKGLLGRFGKSATTALIVSTNNTSRNVGNSSSINMGRGGTFMPQPEMSGGYNGEINSVLVGLDYSVGAGSNLTYLNGTYRHSNKYLTTLTKRTTNLPDGSTNYISDKSSRGISNGGTITMSKSILSDRNQQGKRNYYLTINPNLSFTKGKINDNEQFSSDGNGVVKNSSGTSYNIGDQQNIDAGATIDYELMRGKKKIYFSKFNTTIAYSNSLNKYKNNSETKFGDDTTMLINQAKNALNENFRINSRIVFSTVSDFRFEYRFEFSSSVADIKSWNYNVNTGSYDELSSGGSGYILNQIVEQSIGITKYIGISKRSQRRFLTLSLMAVPMWSRVDDKTNPISYNKWSLQPLISYRGYKYNFSYDGRTKHPSPKQLQHVVNNDNPLYIYSGNPNLHSEYIHKLKFSKIRGLFNCGLDGAMTQNKIIQKRYTNSLGVTTILPVNENGSYNVNARINIYNRLRLFRNTTMGVGLSGRYVNGIGYFDSKKYVSKSTSANGYLNLKYMTPFFESSLEYAAMYSNSRFSIQNLSRESTWTHTLSANISASLPYGVSLISSYDYNYYFGFKTDNIPSSVWNIELCMSILKNRAIVSVKGYDILNQTKNLKVTYADNYIEETLVNMIRRYIMFSISFKFGKF